ncbi:50S ribosomal protein L11 [Thermoproteus tenax]|uniref:Large ribosomal subunit protein uL11 n=1 Tax=Thermoproteus tenax (strain ATCC 35583 / DSM 2078 / JCM 9277 / NBRC 100435 / Kra 1) TaxID=768679 RepID=G4RLI2_THETK|nr:50S ribosomal protein L11 [Thermoproteus tenax]CCC82427.1 50S ribosomal protein L11p [Thermoproteus tenax Kra 1]
MAKRIINVPLQGGKFAPNPQFQDSVKSIGLDPNGVAQRVQEELKKYAGYPISKVELEIEESTKEYSVLVKLPPIGDLLLKLLGKDTGAHDAGKETIGNLPFDKIVQIAVLKFPELKSKSLKSAVKQILSTCKAMGITVDGKPAAEVIKAVEAGSYDEILKKAEDQLRR